MIFGPDLLALGVVAGLTYAILAVGLVLIYRSTKVVNFAHAAIGGAAAVALQKLVVDHGVNYWLAFVPAVAMAGAFGALAELTVIRRLFEAPRVILLVATIGLAQLFAAVEFYFPRVDPSVALRAGGFPTPVDWTVTVGDYTLGPAQWMILLVVPGMSLGLAAFFRFSAYGNAIRGASENADSARLAGISVRRMSTFAWTIAGVISGVTAVLTAPSRGISFFTASLGPGLLTRALAAAVIARMTSFPIAFGAGIAIGVIDQVVFVNYTQSGLQQLVVFVIVLGALIVRGRSLGRDDQDVSTWAIQPVIPPVPQALRDLSFVRLGPYAAVGAALVVACALPFLTTATATVLFTDVLLFAIVGLSLTVLTGWAGQLSFGHFALVGVGAVAAARFAFAGWPFPVDVLVAALVGAVVALVVGLPALRIRGTYLAVTTVAFAVMASEWLFTQSWALPDASSTFVDRPGILEGHRVYYFAALGALAGSVWVVRNLRASTLGLGILAVRDNERAATAAAVPATQAKLVAFAISGLLAAFAGGMYAYSLERFGSGRFSPFTSLVMLSMAIIGGLGSVPGAVLGALYVFGIPYAFGNDEILRLLTSGVGLLVLLMFAPGGLAGLMYRARDAMLDRLARAEPATDSRAPEPAA